MAQLIEHEAVEAARLALESSGRRSLRQVQVQQFGDDILLSGRVDSYYLKQLAQEMLREVCDLHRLVNALEVEESQGDEL